MKIAVTGGNGNFGRKLVPYLLEQGHRVVAMDRALPAKQLRGADYLVIDTRDHGALVDGCAAAMPSFTWPHTLRR